jgi:hypothetical protein
MRRVTGVVASANAPASREAGDHGDDPAGEEPAVIPGAGFSAEDVEILGAVGVLTGLRADGLSEAQERARELFCVGDVAMADLPSIVVQ